MGRQPARGAPVRKSRRAGDLEMGQLTKASHAKVRARRWTAIAMVGLISLGACAKPAGPSAAPADAGLPGAALDHFIGDEVGDPTTCVIIADRATRKALYRYGQLFNCVRGLPACD